MIFAYRNVYIFNIIVIWNSSVIKLSTLCMKSSVRNFFYTIVAYQNFYSLHGVKSRNFQISNFLLCVSSQIYEFSWLWFLDKRYTDFARSEICRNFHVSNFLLCATSPIWETSLLSLLDIRISKRHPADCKKTIPRMLQEFSF